MENVAPARTVDKVDREDERRRNAVSATKRIGDSTEHDQAGVNRDQIYSHSNNEFCDGRELAAAVRVPSKENTGSISRGFSTVSSRSFSGPGSRVGSCQPVPRLPFWNNCGIESDPSPWT